MPTIAKVQCPLQTRSRRHSRTGQANGIYKMIARRGRQCGVEVYPHRFRHHFSHTWLDRGGAEGYLMELNGWTSPQMLRRSPAAPAAAGRAGPTTASWPTARDRGCDRVSVHSRPIAHGLGADP